jgi:hypothetical protein
MISRILRALHSIIFGNKNDENPTNENAIWRAMRTIIILGFFMILSICIQHFYKIDRMDGQADHKLNHYVVFFTSFGLLVLIGGASFMSGGLTGFLFGIPKLIQSTNGNSENDNETRIVHNDNLVQVSDWLTKIIVGVGLTQLYKIPGVLQNLGETIKQNTTDNSISVNISIAIIVYFSVTGFGCSYLWTRLYFTGMLASTNKDLTNLLAKANDELVKKEKDIEKKDIELKAVTNTFMPEMEKIKMEQKSVLGPKSDSNDDPHKGKWGGLVKSNDRTVTATVETSSFNKELFNVILKVVSLKTDQPLTGDVIFHLHPTFKDPDKIVKVIDGVAELSFVAYGAFTVGIECDNGTTKLEIDLATDVQGVPQLFKER